MARVHLFEFEDLKWFPKNIRNYMTDFLQFVTNKADFYKDTTPKIIESANYMKTNQILDMASGGGGGWQSLTKSLIASNPEMKIFLSDFYPNHTAFKKLKSQFPNTINYINHSVSALDVKDADFKFRTMFLSFHHFKPEDAKEILRNAMINKAGIGIFEGQKRSIEFYIKNFFSPIFVLFATPFIKPFNWGRILFTYFIPLVPLFVWWDGLVSVARTYSVKELEKIAAEIDPNKTYNWDIGIIKSRGITVPYLIALPKK